MVLDFLSSEAVSNSLEHSLTLVVTRLSITTYRKIKNKEFFKTARAFYPGGFDATMNRREAQLILGVREGANPDVIRAAHRKIMVANHPDAGNTFYLNLC